MDVSAGIFIFQLFLIFSNYEYTSICFTVQDNTYSIYSYYPKGRVIGKFSANNHNWPNLNLISFNYYHLNKDIVFNAIEFDLRVIFDCCRQKSTAVSRILYSR